MKSMISSRRRVLTLALLASFFLSQPGLLAAPILRGGNGSLLG